MTFTFPKSALSPQPSLSERMQRDMAAKAGSMRSAQFIARRKKPKRHRRTKSRRHGGPRPKREQAEQQAARAREAEAFDDNADG